MDILKAISSQGNGKTLFPPYSGGIRKLPDFKLDGRVLLRLTLGGKSGFDPLYAIRFEMDPKTFNRKMLEGIKDEEFSVYVNLQGRLTVMLAVPTDIIGDSFDLTISTLGPVAGDEDVIREEGIVAFRRVIEVVSDWLEES